MDTRLRDRSFWNRFKEVLEIEVAAQEVAKNKNKQGQDQILYAPVGSDSQCGYPKVYKAEG